MALGLLFGQIAEVHKAMEMELITEKAGQQVPLTPTSAPLALAASLL